MVRCYKALSNPPPSCYNLHKVKIHVRRLRSGNGGSSSCAGDQHSQLDSPGPAGSAGGTPNRRTRFRYCLVFSALWEWWLNGETRGGRTEGFWAEGATAICKAFVWPNYYKAPYALNWQRRACCYMTRGTRRGFFFSFPLFSITRRTEKIAKGLLWNQAKAVWSLRALERAARMQLCRDWSRSDCSEGGESSGRGSGTSAWCCQHGSGPASPRADRRLTGGEDGRKNMKCPFLFPCWVSPTSCWESRLYLCWDSTSSP